ncbi:MAG: hypothetical protein HYS58_01585, partial [Elusimicrobia bacterium]|nr:hypothetical protein [Elusimicrobiota bacterium]
LNTLTDFAPFKQNSIGEGVSSGLKASSALNNLMKKKRISSDPLEVVSQPSEWSKTLYKANDILNIAHSLPQGKEFLQKNWIWTPAIQTATFFTNLPGLKFASKVQKGNVQISDIRNDLQMDRLRPDLAQKFIRDKGNEPFLRTALETAEYGNQTTLSPLWIRERGKEMTIDHYVQRTVPLELLERRKFDPGEIAVFASLYKRVPSLNRHPPLLQNSIPETSALLRGIPLTVSERKRILEQRAVAGELNTFLYQLEDRNFREMVAGNYSILTFLRSRRNP